MPNLTVFHGAQRVASWCMSLLVAALLTACGGGGGSDGGGGSSEPGPVDPLPNPRPREASRFLARATFGPTETEVNALTQSGYEAWLRGQFAQPQASHVAYLDLERPAYQAKTPPSDVGFNQSMESFWKQAVSGPDPLRQRAVFALSEIFVISTEGSALSNEPYAISSFQDMLVRNAFGNFRTLLEEVSLHPAVGRYLSHLANQKERTNTATGVTRLPDENYAREVMQLFTIGLWELNSDGTQKKDGNGNPISTYGQEEILGMAKVFTGWSWGHCLVTEDACFRGSRNSSTVDPSLNRWRSLMQPFDRFHSTAEKKIISGRTLPGGRTARQDLTDALDTLFNHPNVGPFIGRQLIQHLVTSNPSPVYVQRVAAAFANNGQGLRGDMQAVLRAVLLA